MIYLDNNATTRIDPEVIELMARHWRDAFANPGSRHSAGRRARQVLETARESIASILGAQPDEVIFTGGGTESNNMAVLGLTSGSPGTIALTVGEHPAVGESCRHRQSDGWHLEWLPVDSDGLLRPDGVEGLFEKQRHLKPIAPTKERLKLVATILAHNETGTIQDLGRMAKLCQNQRVPLHLDAVQAVGKIPINFGELGAVSLAFAAHKFGGPRGIGGLLLRRGVRLTPTQFGGHQEAERRPGTEAVPLIAGMARALELRVQRFEEKIARQKELRDRFEARLENMCPPVVVNGSTIHRLPNTSNLAFPGADGEALLVALDLEGICCSLGSTCASGSAEPSPVLLAMEKPPEIWKSSVRFSLGIDTTEAEIEQAAEIIARVVNRLRKTP